MEYIFHIGAFGLRWYSLLVATGLLAGAWIATIEARRRGDSPDHVSNAVLICLPLALIGARAYHVIHEWSAIYSKQPFYKVFAINEGGIGIYGAMVGSIAGIWIYCKLKHLPVSRWLDIGAPGLMLGQAIGRWGNYFNQELYGKPTDVPWALHIPFDKREPGYENFETYHPLFLYESMLNLLGFALLMYLGRRYKDKLKSGDIAFLYGLFYGIIRISLEPLRIGNWHFGSLPTATIISFVVILVCAAALIYRHFLDPKRHTPPPPIPVSGPHNPAMPLSPEPPAPSA